MTKGSPRRILRLGQNHATVGADHMWRAKVAVAMIRVLLADDNAFVRQSLGEFLDCDPGIEVVAVCADGDEVLAAADCRPDVVVLDVVMQRVGGLEAARALLAAHPGARVLMLTASPSEAAVREARRIGASGYLLKTDDPAVLSQAVHTVATGGTAWGPSAGALSVVDVPLPAVRTDHFRQ
jgi:two-component system response regulator DesR